MFAYLISFIRLIRSLHISHYKMHLSLTSNLTIFTSIIKHKTHNSLTYTSLFISNAMAVIRSASSPSAALFIMLNLLFFCIVVSACDPQCPGPKPKPKPKPSPKPSPSSGTCPRDTLKLGVCANVLNGLIDLKLGNPPKEPCCTLIQGLADVEAAACLCTALKANVLGLNLNVPVSLSLLLNYCGCETPRGFQCA